MLDNQPVENIFYHRIQSNWASSNVLNWWPLSCERGHVHVWHWKRRTLELARFLALLKTV